MAACGVNLTVEGKVGKKIYIPLHQSKAEPQFKVGKVAA